MKDAVRSRLTFANVVSSTALFVALGGSAYAVGALPANSVGRPQLRENAVGANAIAAGSVGASELKPQAVTSHSLAEGSVGLTALDPTVRLQLARGTSAARSIQGTPGATGAAGPRGPAGAPGPGAVRVHYHAHASASPDRAVVTDIGGLRMEAQCEDTGGVTQLNLAVVTPEPATGIESISVDGGTGELSFGQSQTANLSFELPAGTTLLGGPSSAPGEYGRILANLIYVAAKSTVHLTIGLVLDGSAKTCAVDGVGVPATD
jgi:hypothetical protein